MGKTFIGLVLVVFAVGIMGGFFMSRSTATNDSILSPDGTTPAMIKTAKEVGSTDKSFKDTATGVVRIGGLNGEGTHSLERDGGPSQTVYLISSVVDLSEFDGKKVEIWGATMRAAKVPWLMDVGRVKLTE